MSLTLRSRIYLADLVENPPPRHHRADPFYFRTEVVRADGKWTCADLTVEALEEGIARYQRNRAKTPAPKLARLTLRARLRRLLLWLI
jgi:hypothetical protein